MATDGRETLVDSIPLMIQLAKLAGIEAGGFRRMVLVLDIDQAPKLYTEGLLRVPEGQVVSLAADGVLKTEEAPVMVDMTTWRVTRGQDRSSALNSAQ